MENSNKISNNPRIRLWLNQRGITDKIIYERGIFWTGRSIAIPIYDEKWRLLYHKYRRDPASEEGPKYTYDQGGTIRLYCADNLLKSNEIVICEGEFDALILESKGFHAVTSTSGATSFQADWAPLFTGKEVYVCLDNDKAGKEGTIKICSLVPHAKYIPLPPEVGEHGDVTDYFVKLGKTAEDFRALMRAAEPLPVKKDEPKSRKSVSKALGTDLEKAKAFPIEDLLPEKINAQGFTHCPLHMDETPSLKVYSDNRFYCYSCGAGGDTVFLVSKLHSISMKEAINMILKK